MDAFSYHNLFETKGVEYLIIIAFLILMIPFYLFLNRTVKVRERIREFGGFLVTQLQKIPHGVLHAPNHTWVHLTRAGVAEVGMDNLLTHLTGEVRVKLLKNPGESIRRGEEMAILEQADKSLRIYSPVSGSVEGLNPDYRMPAPLTGEDPYGHEWLMRIKPSAWTEETRDYYLAGNALEWMKRETERFRDFLSLKLPVYEPGGLAPALQDGGEISSHVLSELPAGLWKEFQKDFLDQR